MYHHSRFLVGVLMVTVATAAEPTKSTSTPTAIDPTTAIVAEGRFVYRQRDLDALVLIAKRHAKGKISDSDLEVVRQALIRLCTAREAFADALTALPPNYPQSARDALALDLLDYQAEPSTRPVAAPRQETASVPTTAATDPVLVRLPPLTLNRTIAGVKQRLVLGLALYFRDQTLAKRLEPQAPLVQDAILKCAQALPDAQFLNPDQMALKAALITGIQAVVPEFPKDGILIPQLDQGEPTETKP